MWMLPPERLCRKHLLGEHVETHMFLGSLLRGKALGGFFEKKLLEPERLYERHGELSAEMLRRGYAHRSPMDPAAVARGLASLSASERATRVLREESLRSLSDRCEACNARLGGRDG